MIVFFIAYIRIGLSTEDKTGAFVQYEAQFTIYFITLNFHLLLIKIHCLEDNDIIDTKIYSAFDMNVSSKVNMQNSVKSTDYHIIRSR